MDVGVDDPSFPGRVSELEGLVDEHVVIEEAELFPMAREQLDAGQPETIAREMIAVMAELQQEGPRASSCSPRPSPRATKVAA